MWPEQRNLLLEGVNGRPYCTWSAAHTAHCAVLSIELSQSDHENIWYNHESRFPRPHLTNAEIPLCSVVLSGEEASRLWETLNNLARDEPITYHDFMTKQLQHLDSDKDGEAVLNQQSATRRCRQCHYSCWRQVSLWKYSFNQREIKLFINICHHSTAVPKPYDANGNIVAESRQENILIPLIISKLRNCFDSSNNKAMAVDVIVNSCCINFCTNTKSFKSVGCLISKLIDAINSDQGSSTGSESLEDYQLQV